MKLALGVSLLSGVSLIVLYGIIVGVMVPKWQQSVDQLWSVTADQTYDTMVEVVNTTLAFIQFVARTVPHVNPPLPLNETGGYDPASMLHAFIAFDGYSGYRFGSLGFLKRASPGPGRLPNAKVSWQIAKDYRCPDYMYAFSDDAIHPQFVGYCAVAQTGVIQKTVPPAYVGSDWGLKPTEVALLDNTLGIPGTFLPIFDLFGAFTLTYETRWPENAAVAFAELDLSLFSNHLNSRLNLLNGKGIAFIYETTSGAMIASTVNGTIFDSNHTRYFVANISNAAIRDTADGQDDAWLITRCEYAQPGLNWTIVVAVQDSDIKGNLHNGVIVASVASLGALIGIVLLTWLGMHCCVTRPLKAKRESSVDIPYTIFDEVK